MIDRVGVVVPARNEEELLPVCLAAMATAVECVPRSVAVHVVVVLDGCTDRSREVTTAHPWVTTVEVAEGNVGAARAAGVAEVMRWNAAAPVENLWISTTDADSQVPSEWILKQLQLAQAGWEVIVGTVTVDDWSGRSPAVALRWKNSYYPVEGHPHVHGANLGFSATAYLDSGGWLPVAVDEDVSLVAAMGHRRMLRTARLPVRTSARRDPRAARGFGDTLSNLAG